MNSLTLVSKRKRLKVREALPAWPGPHVGLEPISWKRLHSDTAESLGTGDLLSSSLLACCVTLGERFTLSELSVRGWESHWLRSVPNLAHSRCSTEAGALFPGFPCLGWLSPWDPRCENKHELKRPQSPWQPKGSWVPSPCLF